MTPPVFSRKDVALRRQLARTMPRDFPRGPWQRTVNIGVRRRRRRGEPEPRPCAMCTAPIKRNATCYYQLQNTSDPAWEDAILHAMCADELQNYLGENRLYLQRTKDTS